MMLSDKIIKLRKIHGFSQEAFSKKIEVSKDTINEWESGVKTPDLDQIIVISKKFDTSIDYLLKDNYDIEISKKELDTKTRLVSLEEVTMYLENKNRVSKLTSRGVLLCINSIVPLFVLLFLTGQNYIDMSTDLATTVGLILLFVFISVAMGLFVKTTLYNSKISKIEKKDIELENSVKSSFREKLENYKPIYLKRISIAVILIIMSVVPLISVSILMRSNTFTLLLIVIEMLMLSFGVHTIILTSTHFNTLKYIVKIGDVLAPKSKQLKRAEKVAIIYWPLVLAGYIGWSLWTMAWGTTWIMLPVSALLFIALIGCLALFDSND